MYTLASKDKQSWLVWFLRGLLILGFIVLTARLFDLQIIRGTYFHALAEDNRIRKVPIEAPRGLIKARGGEVLVGNREVKRTVEFLSDGSYLKKAATSNVGEEQLITESVRDYTVGSELGHISGYLGEVTEDELGRIKGKCPEKGPRQLGNLVGRSGLEEMYDCEVTGIPGEELVEVDSMGRKIRTLGRKNPVAGDNITISIDYGLQRYVAQLMKDKKGVAIATDPKGQVLALFSSPSYDPNVFVSKQDPEMIKKILEDPGLPLFDRAIGGLYHPGSVFKPIVAIAALSEGAIDEDYTFTDTGSIDITSPYGSFSYKNWYFTQYGGTEGEIGLERAITRSTDTFFYKTGELTGIDDLVDWAQKFNLDKKTGIDLPGEVAGLVPSPSWKIQTKGERWFLGNTYHFSIGQGDLALTPVGVNTAIAAIATNGHYCRPHLLVDNGSDNNDCSDLELKDDYVDMVKKGMDGACNPGGTGVPFFDFKERTGLDVACKTGTAEDERGDPHAWFTAFAPLEEPDIIVTVMIEHGGEGSKVAAPIARNIFNHWFKVPDTTPTPSVSLTPTPAND